MHGTEVHPNRRFIGSPDSERLDVVWGHPYEVCWGYDLKGHSWAGLLGQSANKFHDHIIQASTRWLCFVQLLGSLSAPVKQLMQVLLAVVVLHAS